MRLDIGCGKNCLPGFDGVDVIDFGQKYVMDVRKKWKFKDEEVEEVHSSHCYEHLTNPERIHFMNELYRVLKPGGKATIIVPHWSNAAAYGDPTHQWPPVSEWACFYWSKEWRDANAPHVPLNCNFSAVYGYSFNESDPDISCRNMDYRQMACKFQTNFIRDIHFTLTKI